MAQGLRLGMELNGEDTQSPPERFRSTHHRRTPAVLLRFPGVPDNGRGRPRGHPRSCGPRTRPRDNLFTLPAVEAGGLEPESNTRAGSGQQPGVATTFYEISLSRGLAWTDGISFAMHVGNHASCD